jgi:type IV pilus assembly protein PilP
MTRNLLHPNSRVYAVTAFLCAALSISGCGKKEQPPVLVQQGVSPVVQPAVKPIQKSLSSAIKPLPIQSGNLFDFSSKKDPFKPFIQTKSSATPTPAELKKALLLGLPIHSFDVSQFRLIGVVTGGKENQAMVVDPNGKGYVLKVGMSIGKNDGRITSITSGGVDVTEQFKDDNGRVRKENIRITLPRKQ